MNALASKSHQFHIKIMRELKYLSENAIKLPNNNSFRFIDVSILKVVAFGQILIQIYCKKFLCQSSQSLYVSCVKL